MCGLDFFKRIYKTRWTKTSQLNFSPLFDHLYIHHSPRVLFPPVAPGERVWLDCRSVGVCQRTFSCRYVPSNKCTSQFSYSLLTVGMRDRGNAGQVINTQMLILRLVFLEDADSFIMCSKWTAVKQRTQPAECASVCQTLVSVSLWIMKVMLMCSCLGGCAVFTWLSVRVRWWTLTFIDVSEC